MTTPKRRSLTDWASLLALVVCWGSTFAITKVAIETISPIWTVALRMIFGLVIFIPVFWIAGERLPTDRRFWTWMLWIAIVGTSLPLFLISWGTQYVDTNVAGVLVSAVPLFVVVFAHFALPDEPATVPKVIGLVIGFIGLIVLIGPGEVDVIADGTLVLLGELAIVAAALGYAVQGVSARIMPPATVLQKTLANLSLAAVLSGGAALMTGIDGVSGASVASLIAVAALGLITTAAAGIIMFRLIATAGPSFASLTSYLIPVYTMLLGTLALGEILGPQTFTGLVLVLVGIAISEFWPKRRRA